jgi:hypothetical protein
MLDLLLGLLEVLLEFFFEAAFELAAEAMTDLILRGLVAVFDNSEFTNPFLAYVGYIFLGGLSGGFSVLAFPHPFVHPSRIPGMSLVASPVLTGLAMWFLGSLLRKSGKKVMRIESFGYGFAFALGMALVRFVFMHNVLG